MLSSSAKDDRVVMELPSTLSAGTQASWAGLFKQGIQLHLATIWGALRASQRFKEENPGFLWKKLIAKRFFDEYGLNLLLFLAFQVIIFSWIDPWWIGELVVILLIPFLSVLQVMIDRGRKDSTVYESKENSSGLSVRIYDDSPGQESWVFFNHFALPVGQGEGVKLRRSLHQKAQDCNVNLLCHAQNDELARYYLQEMPGGVNLGGERPLLLWQYAKDAPAPKESSGFRTLIGLDSTRNSGQIPKRARKQF